MWAHRRAAIALWFGVLGCGARSELALEAAVAERCNGRDDDGDGEVDEDIAPITCGEGACAATAPGCVDGEPGTCTPAPPGVEVCNGIDDDCDGAIDEDLDFGQISGPHVVGTSAFYAYGLVATDGGALVSWASTIDGSNPVPNGFARPLDPDGVAAGPTVQLIEAPVALGVGPSLAPAAKGFAVAMCRRFGPSEHPSWMFVDALGQPTAAEHAVAETSEDCTTHDTPPQLLWTGERHLFTWITSSTNRGVFVEATDASGGSATITPIAQGDSSAPPRLAQHDDRVVLVVGERPEPKISELSVYASDRKGTSFAKIATLPDPGGTGYLQPRIAFDPHGTLLVVATNRFDPGWIRARISAGGDIVAAPALEPESLEFRDLAARAGGGFWATAVDRMTAETFLVQLDEEGAITDRFPAPEEPASNPILAARAGRVHVVYTVFNEPTSDELHSVVYGCIP